MYAKAVAYMGSRFCFKASLSITKVTLLLREFVYIDYFAALWYKSAGQPFYHQK
jgi:hypothetical protein